MIVWYAYFMTNGITVIFRKKFQIGALNGYHYWDLIGLSVFFILVIFDDEIMNPKTMRVILLSISKLLTFLGMKWIIYIYSRVDVIYSHLYILVTKQFIMKLPSFRFMCMLSWKCCTQQYKKQGKNNQLKQTPELHWYFFLWLHLVFFIEQNLFYIKVMLLLKTWSQIVLEQIIFRTILFR